MNLIVDIGNTFVKFAVFSSGVLKFKETCLIEDFVSRFKRLYLNYPKITAAIISTVGALTQDQLDEIKADIEVLELNYKTILPFKNLYTTPETLGVDRIALVAASVKHFPNSNVLVIDAGTCITYDFVTATNIYLGGSISPGLRLRYKVLNELTANLPLLETSKPNSIIGKSTAEAIHSGVVFGIVKEIDGLINEYKSKYQDLTVILTGGDAIFLSNQLKNSIFANSNFLLEGLNFILDFNSK